VFDDEVKSFKVTHFRVLDPRLVVDVLDPLAIVVPSDYVFALALLNYVLEISPSLELGSIRNIVYLLFV
jgi:hypothetical protein